MVSVKITTAIELSATQRTAMEKALTKARPDQKLSFEYVVDPKVLGGVKLTVGSQELDGTVRTKLSAIKHQLLTNL